MKKLTVLTALLLFTIGSVFAQRGSRSHRNGGNGVNQMHYEMRVKIADGIIDGTITAREARRLLEVSEDISFRKERMNRNGRLTQRELDRLRRDLRDLDRMIVREVRDGDRIRNGAFDRNGRFANNGNFPNNRRATNNGRAQRF